MGIKQRLFHAVVGQFHDPTGPAGHVVGWVMGTALVMSAHWLVA